MGFKMRLLVIFLLLLVHWTKSECPNSASIAPCECQYQNGEMSVFCESLELPQLTTMLRDSFCGRTIHKFFLRAPNIDYLPSNLFFKNIVHEFQVENANISHFTQAGRSAFFGQEPYLELLSMRRCSLGDELSWEMIAELRALHYLDLSYNKLKKVPKQWFYHSPPSLRSLILKENQISQLEPGAFRYMFKLNELDLSSNSISEISRNLFPYPGNELIFLRLSDNNLRSLPEDLFDEMFGLRRLYLDNNKLSTLAENVWKPILGELERVELYGNPIDCGCNLEWISELKLPQHFYGKCNSNAVKNIRPIEVCKYPDLVELRKLAKNEFYCWFCDEI
ncbi:leucine-rich repeat-containing protein 15 [Parasteatoda tepidariorum]|uniref:leucine-rich repeat-containing protein 15 n=1 Tax=Parasteatoda tepidariorum TaxID=114398 RepID=UPI00077FCE64|nr:carboxypeptidase N subunit 2 [Parasteatoda tepidariorum]